MTGDARIYVTPSGGVHWHTCRHRGPNATPLAADNSGALSRHIVQAGLFACRACTPIRRLASREHQARLEHARTLSKGTAQ